MPGATRSRGLAISGNGTVVAGYCYFPAGYGRAFRWTAGGGMQDLGVLPGDTNSGGTALSGDGSVVAGVCTASAWSANRPFLWIAALGMVDLNTYLVSLGLDLTGWTLTDAEGLSADGSALTGWGTYKGGQCAWLVTGLPEPASAALFALAMLCAVRPCRSQPQVGRNDLLPRGSGTKCRQCQGKMKQRGWTPETYSEAGSAHNDPRWSRWQCSIQVAAS